jgi:hypothetical protein
MVMSKEQRCELLQLAREAKAKKKLERDADKPVVKRGRKKKEEVEVVDEPMEVEAETVINDDTIDDDFVIEPIKKTKPKVKKEKEPVRSLDLNNDVDVDDNNTIIEEIVEIRKKPKKKIVKKIIYESDSEDEVEEVVIQKNKPKKETAAKVKKVAKPVPLEAPKEVEVKPQFSFFNC